MARVLFVQWDDSRYPAIEALSAWLSAHGYRADVTRAEQAPRLLRSGCYSLVGFSVNAAHLGRYASTATTLKARFPQIPHVVGGVLPTMSPESVRPSPDYLVRGDGEHPLLCLLQKLEGTTKETVPGLHAGDGVSPASSVGCQVPVQSLPLPDCEVYYRRFSRLARKKVAQFVFSRGCAFHCTFCYAPAWKSLYRGDTAVRIQPPERAIEQMEDLRRFHPFLASRISDDNFGADVAWLAEFVRLHRTRIARPFACNLRADLVTEERLALLQGAGCVEIGLGVETADPVSRARLLGKSISDDCLRSAFDSINRRAMASTAFVIVGLPGETEERVAEALEFVRRLRARFVWLSRLQVYPGTPLERLLKRTGDFEHRPRDFARAALPDRDRVHRAGSWLRIALSTGLAPHLVARLARGGGTRILHLLERLVERHQLRGSIICGS